MNTIVNVLLKVFEHEAQQARCVLATIDDTHRDFTPKEGMRTLWKLANHLAQIPLLDPAMYTRELPTLEQTQAKEKELWRDDLKGLLASFDNGIKGMKNRFQDMSEKEFFAEHLKPFYSTEPEKNWAYYLPEIITHIAMHKMQLWMYLKLAGAKVDMMTYYGYVPE